MGRLWRAVYGEAPDADCAVGGGAGAPSRGEGRALPGLVARAQISDIYAEVFNSILYGVRIRLSCLGITRCISPLVASDRRICQ